MKTKEITLIKKISPIAQQAVNLEITSPTQMKVAVEILSQLNQFNDQIREEKEKVTKPLNEALKAERGRWKPLETMYEEAIELLRSKMSVFQTQAEKERKEAEQAIASRIAPGRGNLSLETAVKKIDGLEKVEKNISTDIGSVSFRQVKKYEVMDISLVPIEYHTVNDPMIKEAMKKDIELPGVRYWTEQIPANFR